jgi:hypothetical protein
MTKKALRLARETLKCNVADPPGRCVHDVGGRSSISARYNRQFYLWKISCILASVLSKLNIAIQFWPYFFNILSYNEYFLMRRGHCQRHHASGFKPVTRYIGRSPLNVLWPSLSRPENPLMHDSICDSLKWKLSNEPKNTSLRPLASKLRFLPAPLDLQLLICGRTVEGTWAAASWTYWITGAGLSRRSPALNLTTNAL